MRYDDEIDQEIETQDAPSRQHSGAFIRTSGEMPKLDGDDWQRYGSDPSRLSQLGTNSGGTYSKL